MQERFLPTEKNDYRPHVLQKSAVIAMGLLVVLTFTIANIHTLVWISSDWLVSTILPAVIVDETNVAREDNSLSQLRRNEVLDAAATDKAEHMAAEGYFAHYSPDGVSPWHWMKLEGYNFVHAGENLAVHFTDSADVVKAWMKSPTHRENILDAEYEEIGIGIARGEYEGYDTIFVVQMFGTPANANVEEVAIAETDTSKSVETETREVVAEQPVAPVVAGEHTDTDEYKVLTSDHLSTTTVGATAVEEVSTNISTQESTPMWQSVATQPKTALQLIYFAIGLFVIAVLILSIIIEIRHQRLTQIGYGVGLLALMYVLLQVHLSLVGSVTII